MSIDENNSFPNINYLSAILSRYLAMKIILTISNASLGFSVNNSVVWDNIISNKSSTLSSSLANYSCNVHILMITKRSKSSS